MNVFGPSSWKDGAAISRDRGGWGRTGCRGPGAQLWASEREALLDDQEGMLSPQLQGEVQAGSGNLGAAARGLGSSSWA